MNLRIDLRGGTGDVWLMVLGVAATVVAAGVVLGAAVALGYVFRAPMCDFIPLCSAEILGSWLSWVLFGAFGMMLAGLTCLSSSLLFLVFAALVLGLEAVTRWIDRLLS